jgi:hypothetical protein
VGNSLQSADQITAWHANGSEKLKTLLNGTSVLPRNRNYYIWRNNKFCRDERQEDLASGRKGRVGYAEQTMQSGQCDRGNPKLQLHVSSSITFDQRADFDINGNIVPQRRLGGMRLLETRIARGAEPVRRN